MHIGEAKIQPLMTSINKGVVSLRLRPVYPREITPIPTEYDGRWTRRAAMEGSVDRTHKH